MLQPELLVDVESQSSKPQPEDRVVLGGRGDGDWWDDEGQAGEIRKTVSIHQHSGHARL